MVNISIRYTGELHCEAVHGPSHSQLQTDAPVDNQGKGEAFSPTDLVATALGTCMLTIAAMAARNHNVELAGSTVTVTKEMSSAAPRRIARLSSEIHIPLPATCEHRKAIEAAALGCPVHRSLHPEVEKPVQFFWEG